MEFDHDDSILLDFELKLIAFGSKSKGRLSPQSYSIHVERKLKNYFPSVPYRLVEVTQGGFFILNFLSCCFCGQQNSIEKKNFENPKNLDANYSEFPRHFECNIGRFIGLKNLIKQFIKTLQLISELKI